MDATAGIDLIASLGLDRQSKRRRRWHRLVWLAVLLAVGTGLTFMARRRFQPAGLAYDTRPLERRDLQVTVTATGAIQPRDAVDVGPEASGRVRAVHADFNQRVHQGQVLVELDTDLLRAQVDQASSQVALARANLARARLDLEDARLAHDRARLLADRGAISQQELDLARSGVHRAIAAQAAAQAEEAAARANLTVMKTSLARSTVVSPIDGVVLTRSVEVGQTVVSALSAPVLFRLAEDLGHMQLVVAIDEADIGRVAVGQDATFTVAAYPSRTFRARVSEVHNAARIVENVVTYDAVLEIDNRDGALRPGMTGTAQIVTTTEPQALVVPNAALRYQPSSVPPDKQESTPGVWVLRQGQAVRQSVQVGATDGERTVVSGLQPGEQVIIGSHQAQP